MSLTRQQFLRLSASLPVAAAAAGCATSRTPSASRILIQNADVLSMTAPEDEFIKTDVLIENGRIASIGKGLSASGAQTINGSGMILMPGMVDGHRHVWQTLLNGLLPKMSQKYAEYDRRVNMVYALAYEPEDMLVAQQLGGMTCIDSGVTSVVDQMHAANGDAMEQAAARGLVESGVAGVFCYQMRNGPYYTVGDTYTREQALADRNQPPDERHWANAERIRDMYFSGKDRLVHFGIGLTGSVGSQTVDQAAEEFRRARALEVRMLTQHMNQRPGTKPPILRGVADLHEAGLLGPDYLISHGVDMTDQEMGYLRDAGSGLCSTVMGEFPYEKPSVHGRAIEVGLDVSIGVDVSIALTHDYFEHVRAAYWNLFRTERGAALSKTIEPFDVLDIATRMGARAIGFEDEIGTIEVGKRADLVLLRTDRIGFSRLGSLAERIVTSANQSDVDTVLVNGAVKKRNGRILGLDKASLEADASQSRRNVIRRAAEINLL
ncbi:amidohydrolase family protein [Henriciella sp. AS95]|uniref:amidohydrolase family protein n=1 Tax=Henriciella sp. AS95 TaxID=3135782 RepID=UPI00317DC7E3